MDDQDKKNPQYSSQKQQTNPQVVFLWKAPLRAYKRQSKKTLRFYLAVALLLSIIVYFFSDPILILPTWGALFLFYTFTITPPPIIENKITKFGIETAGITLRWDSLSHFYFKELFGFTVLIVVTDPPYNLHSYLIIPNKEIEKKVTKILVEHIIFQDKPQKNLTDKMIDWLSFFIPEDEPEELKTNNNFTMKIEEEDKLNKVKHTLESLFQKPLETSPEHQTSAPTS
ncbi:hypothetical protein KC726_02985 [Candidatus Woesebacteria bacterium]|nr:hypothetical protein [Candidatus Woesebacteria bacterium]